MALEMVERKVRLTWSNGIDVASISHNVSLETALNLGSDDHLWYKITAERIGNVGENFLLHSLDS